MLTQYKSWLIVLFWWVSKGKSICFWGVGWAGRNWKSIIVVWYWKCRNPPKVSYNWIILYFISQFFLGADPHSPSMYYFRQLIKFMLIPRLLIQFFWFASNLHVALDSTINYTTQFLNLVYNPHFPTTFLCLMKLVAKALSKINH